MRCSLSVSAQSVNELKPVQVFGYVGEEGYAKYSKLCKLLLDEEKKMYGCKMCIANGKIEGYRDKHKILDHVETHHVKSTYECGECGIFLPTRAMINMHKLKKHSEEILNSSKNIVKVCPLLHIQESGTAKLV